MKRYIHIPTLLLHGLLLLNAAFAINEYSDYFLVSSLIALAIYCIYILRQIRKEVSPISICGSFILGALVQFIVFRCGIINVHSGAFGLGGGEFALLIYGFAMVISCVVVFLICSRKKHSK